MPLVLPTNGRFSRNDCPIPFTDVQKARELETLTARNPGTFPVEVPADFMIIAHRGASAYAPEHTRPAFDKAISMGSRHVEVDTQVTADGVVILCHNMTLDAYGVKGRDTIRNLNYYGDLENVDIGAWFGKGEYSGQKMMTLDSLFEEYGRSFFYHIELKSRQESLCEAVMKSVRKSGMEDNVLFTSFKPYQLGFAKDLAPDIPRAYLVRYVDYRVLNIAEHLGVQQICPRADLINPDMVAAIGDLGMQTRAWGVSWLTKDPGQYLWRTLQVINSGCIGTTIDNPDYLIQTRP